LKMPILTITLFIYSNHVHTHRGFSTHGFYETNSFSISVGIHIFLCVLYLDLKLFKGNELGVNY